MELKSYLRSRKLTKISDLGSGATADVFLCSDTNDRKVVVKQIFLSPRIMSYYQREVAVMKALNKGPGHPNVVKYIHSEIQDEYGYIEQEYVPGIDVDTLTILFGKTNSLFCIKFIKSLLSALEYIHGLKVYHQDLNHNNVIVCLDKDDLDMPLTAKIIDFGTAVIGGDREHGTRIGSTLFDWPYNPDIMNPAQSSSQTKSCNDIWQAGQLLYQIAYAGSFRRFNPLIRGPAALVYFTMRMPTMGGYPVPPKDKVALIPDDARAELRGELMEDQALVVSAYTDYVLKEQRDPVYDFDPDKPSEIHDIVRLLLARKLEDCVSATEALKYVEMVWDDANLFGVSIQKGKINNCGYPCEDPLNSYYKENCETCDHCEWVDKGVKRNGHTSRCIPKKPSTNSETDRKKALKRGLVWNPYRKTVEHLDDDMDNAYVSNRYSFLFKDGLERTKPVPGAEIKRRFRERDFKLLNSDEQVLKVLENFSYHPLQTHNSYSFFFDYFLNRRVSDDFKLIRSKAGFTRLIDLHNLRTDVELGRDPEKRKGKASKTRWTYKEPPPREPTQVKPKKYPVDSMSLPLPAGSSLH